MPSIGDTRSIHSYSRDEHLDDKEKEEIRKGQVKSDDVAKAAAKKAGIDTTGIRFTGHEKTQDEILHDPSRQAPDPNWNKLFKQGRGIAKGTIDPFDPKKVGVGMPLGMIKNHAKNIVVAAEARLAGTRDAMYLALQANIDGLPNGFCEQQKMARRECGDGFQAPWFQAATAMRTDPELRKELPALQRRSDEGMHAALTMVASGGSQASAEDYFKGHPEYAAKYKDRYENDPAFRIGFDAAVWSARESERKGGDGEALHKLQSGLQRRDEWFTREMNKPVQVRG